MKCILCLLSICNIRSTIKNMNIFINPSNRMVSTATDGLGQISQTKKKNSFTEQTIFTFVCVLIPIINSLISHHNKTRIILIGTYL